LAAAAAEVVGGDGAVAVGASVGLFGSVRPSSRAPAGEVVGCRGVGLGFGGGHGEEQVVASEAVGLDVFAKQRRDLGGEFDPSVFLVFGVVLDDEPGASTSRKRALISTTARATVSIRVAG
jgi:hypothetical protein